MAENRIALVTGANKGIGLETARQLATIGITVVMTARDAERGAEAAERLIAQGLPVRFVRMDVADPQMIGPAVRVIESEYGRLDILINNAGVGIFGTATSEEDPGIWRHTFEVNVLGLVHVTQAFLPLLRKSPAGRIVHLTSILGSLAYAADPDSPTGAASGFGTAYSASKAAVNMYTIHLAKELAGTQIKVNAAHPGWVKTDMGGEGATMELTDGAKTSVLLATLPDDGPSGGFFFREEVLPW
ncbi:MAG: SDR family oxidoreductase [Capsulimonadales bacterium]|nr:SDR family oxidoreductase [Capsulimonadales bacterium]